jgi:hypothetical protein
MREWGVKGIDSRDYYLFSAHDLLLRTSGRERRRLL